MVEQEPNENDAEQAAAPAPEATEAPDTPEGQAAPDAAEGEPAPEPSAAPVSARERTRQGRAARASGRSARTPEERQAERDAERRRKAKARTRYRIKVRAKAAAARPDSPPEPTPPVSSATGRPKVRSGVVVSDKADKTITVRIDMARRHRRYQKIVRRTATLHAHDEGNDANAGDTVRVVECRPRSRTKRWRLVEVLERAR